MRRTPKAQGVIGEGRRTDTAEYASDILDRHLAATIVRRYSSAGLACSVVAA